MRTWLKRMRGAVGIGLAWAAAHFGVGLIVGLAAYEFGAGAFGRALSDQISLSPAGVVP